MAIVDEPFNGLQTGPAPNLEWLARMRVGEAAEQQRETAYGRYQDYYDGQHPAKLPSFTLDRLQRYTGFRANICQVIVDALAERLQVIGFTATGPDAGGAEKFLTQLWQYNRMDNTQATIHTECAMLGDSYIIVDWDNDRKRPRLTYQPAGIMAVEYADPSNQVIVWATKQWVDRATNTRRLNRYLPDRVERYYTTLDKGGPYSNADWKPYTADGQDAVLPWVGKDGKPLGVAVIPFRNKPNGKDYGRSELMGVIPLQDAINKTLVDLLLVLDAQGWPQRWVTGTEPPGGWQVGPGIVWSSNHPDFKAGELSSADPSGILASLNMLINSAAGLSRTPQHLFHIDGGYPSGEALKTAESGLVGKAKNRQTSLGDAWEDAAMLAMRLDNTYGTGNWDADNLILQATWKDPEVKNGLAQAQEISTKAPWLSHAQVLREFGYPQPVIDKILSEWKQDQLDKNTIGGQLLGDFLSGKADGTGQPPQASVRLDAQGQVIGESIKVGQKPAQGPDATAPNPTPGGQSMVRNTDR